MLFAHKPRELQRRGRRATWGWVAAVLLLQVTGSVPAAQLVHTNGVIAFVGQGFVLTFSDTNGSLLSVASGGQTPIVSGGELGLWSATFQAGGSVNATGFTANAAASRFSWAAAPGGTGLLLDYTNADISVAVSVTERPDGVDFGAQVTPAQQTVLEFSLPARLRFQPNNLQRLVCPLNSNEAVGASFRPGFFASQPEGAPAGWQTAVKGPSGYSSLYGGPLVVRPDNDPAVPLTITTNGRTWLGTSVAARYDGTNAVVNRPSTASQVDLVLADSVNGPFYAGSHLGGQGWLFRLGGSIGQAQQPLALDLVAATIEHLASAPAAGRTNIGLISLTRGPPSGGWAAVTVSQWRERLQASSVLASANLHVVELTTVQQLLDALATTNYLAILNPYGEWTPVLEQSGMSRTVGAVGGFVRAGGSWFEVGGYSFYYELRPTHYFAYSTPYPPAFADFLHFDTAAGSASLFGVQPQQWAPWAGATNPAAIFVPGRLAWGADLQGGYAEQAFETYVRPGRTWPAPVVRLVLDHSAPDALGAYCQANRFARGLEAKLSASALAAFKQSVLVYYQGNAAEKMAHLDQLPSPALVHFADYLMGGFDKEYPDHLPPNASFGTPADLSALVGGCHQRGLLVMPYTNPTWWCDHPRGPTFLSAGEAPLLKHFDGSLAYELYGANDGYTVCHWHPAVQAANRFTRLQFTTNYPVDLLFEDQCGARTWQYDANPASPTPYAYADGLISMVAEDSQTKPLSTENGWDRIVNYEAQLCGMSWSLVPTENAPAWRTLLDDRFSPATWDIFPLAQYIAHDKTVMVHHDLGQFVTDDQVLAWTLGLGYCLSDRVQAADLDQRPVREWLGWLDRLQKSVCARYVGQPVVAFEQDRGTNLATEPDGLLRATYGPVQITANLSPTPRFDGQQELAPFGFCAKAPGLVAARLNSMAGAGPGQDSVAFVAEDHAGQTEFWVYSTGERAVSLQLPRNLDGQASVQFGQGPTNNDPVQDGVLTLNLGFKPDQSRVLPPAALAGTAPQNWPGPRPAIGVLNLPGMPRSWTALTPADWVQAFQASSLATQYGVPILQLTNWNDVMVALHAGPTVWLALINPTGEMFPASGAGQWAATLSAIKDYVDNGGCWWETAGYSFYSAAFLQSGAWQTEMIGPSGMNFFGVPVGGGEVNQAAEPLTVTAEGQTVLGAELASRLQGLASTVNRGLLRTADDPGHHALLAGAQQDFLGAYRLDGWGYLWRVGGFWPNRDVVLPAATAAMQYLFSHPPLPFPSGPTKYLWHGTLSVQSRPVLKHAGVTNGFFSCAIANCPPGATNALERSQDPAGRGGWQDVFTFLTPPAETNWTDPQAASSLSAFYRLKSPAGQ